MGGARPKACALAALVAAACHPPPDDPEGDAPAVDAGIGAEVDDECVDDDGCNVFVSCVAGVCASAGHDCYADRECGEHFVCVDGKCLSPAPPDCDLPCCDDRGCELLESCTQFRCAPAACSDALDCSILYGATGIFGCYSVDDCPSGADCVNFGYPECIYLADSSCEEAGRRVMLFATPDGAAALLCVDYGTCTDGHCEQ